MPQEILVRPDGKVAYVSCAGTGQVAAIDLAQWKVQRLIAAGFADGLAWAKVIPDRGFLEFPKFEELPAQLPPNLKTRHHVPVTFAADDSRS